MKGYPGGIKTARWLKSHKSRKCRHRINQIVRVYCKDKKFFDDISEGNYPILISDDLHLPLTKEIYDPWCWD